MSSCIVPGCINSTQKSGSRVSLHLFPDPAKEPERHMRWVKVINAEKVFKKDPITVFKQLRVCRIHFDEKSFNGSCKKLLNTAIPTLHLTTQTSGKAVHFKTKLMLYEAKMKKILKQNSIDIENESFQLISEASHSPSVKLEEEELSTQDKLWLSGIDDEEAEEYELMEVEEPTAENQKFTIIMKNDTPSIELIKPAPKTVTKIEHPVSNKSENKSNGNHFKILAPLSLKDLQDLRNDFLECPKKSLAQSICTKIDPLEVATSRSKLDCDDDTFQYTVDLKRKLNRTFTNNFWSRSVFSIMSLPFVKQWNLEEFEFSQAYFFYWDKIERSYYFLNNIVETAKRGEDVNGRLVSFLLGDPIGDGGQWDMIVSIINKHGVMPKKCFPESFSCESSTRMNAILNLKLQSQAKQIRELFSSGASDADIQAKIDLQMSEIYNIVGICLGIPPTSFTWEYYDKNKKYNSVGPIAPLDFYEKHVKPYFNVDDKVCLVTDPRPSNEYGKGYTVDCLGNVVGGSPVFYNNQPVDVLIDLVAKSLKAGEAVWIGCDLKKDLSLAQEINCLDL